MPPRWNPLRRIDDFRREIKPVFGLSEVSYLEFCMVPHWILRKAGNVGLSITCALSEEDNYFDLFNAATHHWEETDILKASEINEISKITVLEADQRRSSERKVSTDYRLVYFPMLIGLLENENVDELPFVIAFKSPVVYWHDPQRIHEVFSSLLLEPDH
eukprot:TRINITY_DN7884_c0_g1_i1.p1 TRINITY_DN7884_c0_g1~~TRINITY_DN7884_c0_g1_i1.p1  ORF type:complete len:160 (+),score=23.45 TRINITY_DN7884_c0_g1_i1:42-521(+)